MTPRDRRAINDRLLGWYRSNGRALAFRETADPWAILVSEVMLQQTQATRVEAPWRRFMARFPTPAALAAAELSEVLRAWAGLGYNRRAVALHRAARCIVEQHGGAVPHTVEQLRGLPGIGPYTARAVAALCFEELVAAVDTNVRRVVSRLTAGTRRDDGTIGAAAMQSLADEMVDPVDPAAWTHAMMDVGASFCRPSTPRCEACPLGAVCGFAMGGPRDGEARARARSGPSAPFPATRRWLRGRIVEALRDAAAGTWLLFDGPIGGHDRAAVTAALDGLERDGLLVRRSDGAARLPSTS